MIAKCVSNDYGSPWYTKGYIYIIDATGITNNFCRNSTMYDQWNGIIKENPPEFKSGVIFKRGGCKFEIMDNSANRV